MGSDGGNPSRPVRAEDSFDVAAVDAWLREHTDARLPDGLPEVTQFPGGASNLTYRLRWPGLDLILRRPPAGSKAKSAHDMGREYRVQHALRPVFGLVPRMVGHCTDAGVIGSEFYVMERLDGVIPRREFGVEVTPEAASALCSHLVDVLVALHAVDVAALPELEALNRGPGYVARQVAGWTDRLARAATEDLGDWAPVTDWLAAHQPEDAGHCLIHNDYRLDNLVLDPASLAAGRPRVLGVLDWEMATVGDPLMDLGGMLSYWVEEGDDEFFRMFRRQPSNAPGMWTRMQVVEAYAARAGLSVTPEQWRFYEVFGLFRLAVIAQQIWYRYFHRQTTNEAYAVFGPAVAYLERRSRLILGLPTADLPRAERAVGAPSPGPRGHLGSFRAYRPGT